jgi:hypothetical protein
MNLSSVPPRRVGEKRGDCRAGLKLCPCYGVYGAIRVECLGTGKKRDRQIRTQLESSQRIKPRQDHRRLFSRRPSPSWVKGLPLAQGSV